MRRNLGRMRNCAAEIPPASHMCLTVMMRKNENKMPFLYISHTDRCDKMEVPHKMDRTRQSISLCVNTPDRGDKNGI
jgi:hypothetical protein